MEEFHALLDVFKNTMTKNFFKELNSKERKMVDLLSRVVDVVGEIYEEQNNDKYPAGNLYPHGIMREEFDQAAIKDPELKRFDTVVERVSASDFRAVPYNVKYKKHVDKILVLLKEAKKYTEDRKFFDYLGLVEKCLCEGSVESYRRMISAWIRTEDYKICFPFTYDELYLDKLMGIKGAFNAGVFIEDPEFTKEIKILFKTVDKFKNTLKFEEPYMVAPSLHVAMYSTLNNKGIIAQAQPRAWSIPYDPFVLRTVGARLIILKENTFQNFDERVYPLLSRIFKNFLGGVSREEMRAGLLWVYTLHELSHNIGRYEREKDLEKYAPLFEELRPYVMPIMWAYFLQREKICDFDKVKSIAASIFANGIVDTLLSEKIPSRKIYKTAFFMEANFFREKGALSLRGDEIYLDMDKVLSVSEELFYKIVRFVSHGNYDVAKKFMEKYDDGKPYVEILKIAKQTLGELTV